MAHRDGIPAELRALLTDPVKLCQDLGLAEHAKRQAGRGISIRCPFHGEKDPSCSVTRGPDGTIRVKCFGCGHKTDALGLIAGAFGMSTRTAFRDVLVEAAKLAGRHDLVDEITGRAEAQSEPRRIVARPVLEPEPERDFPSAEEVAALWDEAIPVTEDADSSGHLVGRRIDPELVARFDLARVLHRQTATDRLPGWARYRGVWWRDTGHRMLVRVVDHTGEVRSLRAWRVSGNGEAPKRLPPAGYRAAGLGLANAPAQAMLRREDAPRRLIVTEGEPDWLVRSLVNANEPVVGVLSGTWSDEWASRVPFGTDVILRTHTDRAGDRYADEIGKTLHGRANLFRLNPTEAA